MSAPARFSAQLAHAGWAVLSWVDGAVSGRRALAQERIRNELLEDRLSDQRRLNAQLLTGLHQGVRGGE